MRMDKSVAGRARAGKEIEVEGKRCERNGRKKGESRDMCVREGSVTDGERGGGAG